MDDNLDRLVAGLKCTSHSRRWAPNPAAIGSVRTSRPDRSIVISAAPPMLARKVDLRVYDTHVTC